MIYERLKELRLSNNLTQADFATAFNISQGTIGNWESGKRTPDIEMIIKISAFFNVSTDYLLGCSDTPNAYTTTTGNTNVIQQCKISHSPIHMNEEHTDGLEHELLSVMKNFSRRDKIKILNFAYEIDEANKKTN